jgi:hypothetical protein
MKRCDRNLRLGWLVLLIVLLLLAAPLVWKDWRRKLLFSEIADRSNLSWGEILLGAVPAWPFGETRVGFSRLETEVDQYAVWRTP